MRLKNHFEKMFDGIYLSYKSISITDDGRLIMKTVGCGCCSDVEPVDTDNLLKAITETEHYLNHLKELKNRIKKNAPLPKLKEKYS
jgi:hypothetical protein